jgi:proline iminopeptidase
MSGSILRRAALAGAVAAATAVVVSAAAMVAASRTASLTVITVSAVVAAVVSPIWLLRTRINVPRWAPAAVVTAFGAAAVAAAATLIATASVIARPWVFLALATLVFVASATSLVAVVTHRLPREPRGRLRRCARSIGVPIGLLVFGLTTCVPIGDARRAPTPVAGRRTWELPTGSRIAYVRLASTSGARRPPVVFLHGGPGIPDMADDSAYFGPLTNDGFTVYVYDQVGSGPSSRLADPRDYSLERDIADLEAIRHQIGASRLILIGHSYGAHLAAGYLARHPHHVASLVAISPEPLDPDDTSPARLTRRLGNTDRLRTYALTAHPRGLTAWALTQVAPEAAHNYAGDAEMDARFDRIYNRTRQALHCPGEALGPALHGLGMYANSVPQSRQARRPPDDRPALSGVRVPALILKGSCDYLSWASAEDYRHTLRGSRLVYLHGGHNLYQDQPGLVMDLIQAFLTGSDLPLPQWTRPTAPPDYRGSNH